LPRRNFRIENGCNISAVKTTLGILPKLAKFRTNLAGWWKNGCENAQQFENIYKSYVKMCENM